MSGLPRKGKQGKSIDWNNAKGYKCKFKYGEVEDDVTILRRVGSKIIFEYNNEEITMEYTAFKECRFGKILGVYTYDFKIEIETLFKDDKRNITIIDREYRLDMNDNNCKWYKYHCNIDNNEDWIIESSLLSKKTGCNVCSGNKILKGVNDINTVSPWMLEYMVDELDAFKYGCCSSIFVKARCPKCGFIKKVWLPNLYQHGFSCNKCGDNIKYPNRFMLHLLELLNIEFETEYSPLWLNGKRFDFYVPSKNLIIEMDGGWHDKDNNMSGQSSEKSKHIDNYKDNKALSHGLKIVRIDCDYLNMDTRFKFIKDKVMSSELVYYFNLDEFDWSCLRINMLNYESNKIYSSINSLINRFDIDTNTLIDIINKGINDNLL